MKCVQIAGPKRLEVTNIKPPVEHDGYVICELKKTGICGSDLHYFVSGEPKGLVMGHEICATVINPGSRKDLKKGDRITALPISPCGKCPQCKNNEPEVCPHTWDLGLGLSLNTPGGYAELTSIRPDMVIKVPNNLTDAEVALVEPTAVSLRAVHRAGIEIGDHVLIIGGGIIGQIAGMFAKKAGATYVAISEANPARGKKAVRLGSADEYFDALDPAWAVNVNKNNPYGYDKVIDCCGNSATLSSALVACKPQGTVVLVGISMEPVSIPDIVLAMHEINVKGAAAYTVEEFKQVIQMMAEKKIDMLKYIDDIVPLDGVQKACERLTSGTDDAIKILIDPSK